MKNTKGFTLIEIIGAVVILGIIAIFAFTTYTSSLRGFRENYYTSLEMALSKSGEEFFSDNRNYRPNGILLAKEVSISTLVTKNYTSKVSDYNGDPCDNSYVIVIKEGKNKYRYHTCLICTRDGYDNTANDKYCDRSWLDQTKVEYGLGHMEPLYIYKNTTRDKLKELLELPVSYIRKNDAGEILAEVRGTGEGEPTIHPSNMDVVNTAVTGVYKVAYEYKGETADRDVIVYENKSPEIGYQKEQKVLKDLSGGTETKTSTYSGGTWTQNVIVSLSSGGLEATGVNIDNVEIEGTETSRFQWNKDGRWQDFCTTDPCTRKITEEMNQTVQFRIIDENGNVSKETEAIEIKIDNTAPTCSLTIPTAQKSHGWYVTDVVINFATKEDLKRTEDVNLVSGIQYYNIQESTKTIDKTKTIDTVTHKTDTEGLTYVGFVIDRAENYATCTTSTIKRDTNYPKCTSIGESTSYVKGSRTITSGCNDEKKDNAYSQCDPDYSGSSKTYDTTTVTATIAAYTIKDMAGNTTTCPQRTVNVYVDNTEPSCTNSGDSTTYATSRTIYYGCSDANSGCNTSYSGGSTPFTTTTVTATIPSYEIRDKVGNKKTCPARTANVYVDKTGPTCTNSGDSTTYATSRTIYYGCSDANVGCDPNNSGGSQQFTTTTVTSTIASYVIKDKLGNSTTCPARTANVYVDKTGPTCTNSGDSTTYAASRTIYYGCSDANVGCDPNNSGGSSLFNTTTTVTSTIASYVIKDKLGNSTTCAQRTANVYVDKTAPSCSFGTGPTIDIGSTGTIELTCTDGNSGVKNQNLSASSFTLSNSNVSITGVTKTAVTNGYKYTITLSASNNGTTTITLKSNQVVDNVSNGSNTPSATITGRRTYTLSFSANGGSGTTSSVSCKITTQTSCDVTLPNNGFSRTGHTFNNWGTSSGASSGTAPGTKVTLTGNATRYALWTVNNYYIDLNGWLDGASNGGLTGYGTCDVTINGTKVKDDVADYYVQHPYGTTYSISDCKGAAGHTYNGVHSGSTLSGTLGAGNQSIFVEFTTNSYTIDINLNLPDGSQPYSTCGAGTFNISYDGGNTIYYGDCNERFSSLKYGSVIIINGFNLASGLTLNGGTGATWDGISFVYTVTGNNVININTKYDYVWKNSCTNYNWDCTHDCSQAACEWRCEYRYGVAPLEVKCANRTGPNDTSGHPWNGYCWCKYSGSTTLNGYVCDTSNDTVKDCNGGGGGGGDSGGGGSCCPECSGSWWAINGQCYGSATSGLLYQECAGSYIGGVCYTSGCGRAQC